VAAQLFPTEDQLEEILVGPGSVTWRLASDSRLYFVMLYPLLLQVAHPTVGAGVRDYSDFEARPWKRLMTTLDYVTLLVYGERDAVTAGQRLRALHKRFRGVREDGKPYHALGRLSRSLTPIMPERMRITGPRQLRWRRRAIARGPLGAGAEPRYVADPL